LEYIPVCVDHWCSQRVGALFESRFKKDLPRTVTENAMSDQSRKEDRLSLGLGAVVGVEKAHRQMAEENAEAAKGIGLGRIIGCSLSLGKSICDVVFFPHNKTNKLRGP
jgi:hypothetical protein